MFNVCIIVVSGIRPSTAFAMALFIRSVGAKQFASCSRRSLGEKIVHGGYHARTWTAMLDIRRGHHLRSLYALLQFD